MRFAQRLPADYKRQVLGVVGENDMVVIYVRQAWTGRDGKRNQALGFDMFRVEDGKIAEHWDADSSSETVLLPAQTVLRDRERWQCQRPDGGPSPCELANRHRNFLS
jgi:predicted SnoaL-like aldol condensation-catalyzing enzyme